MLNFSGEDRISVYSNINISGYFFLRDVWMRLADDVSDSLVGPVFRSQIQLT
jgi:hypothetical protein